MADLINNLGGAAGFGEGYIPRSDDQFVTIDLTQIFGAQGLNFFGRNYTSLSMADNGNITFGSGGLTAFEPFGMTNGGYAMIAPFYADVETHLEGDPGYEPNTVTPTPGGTSQGSDAVWFDADSTGYGTFTVTWDDVKYFESTTEKLNAFQLQLIGTGNGNFDIVFRYESINWTTGSSSGGVDGLGGTIARAGFSPGDGSGWYELPVSGNQDGMLLLEDLPGNTGTEGYYRFSVQNGTTIGESIEGDNTDNLLAGADGDDLISGYDGNDMLVGNAGSDTLTGGAGDDSYTTDGIDTLIENPDEGIDTVFSSATYTLEANLENLILTGTAAADGTGNALDNFISGNAGSNVLDGGDGIDTVDYSRSTYGISIDLSNPVNQLAWMSDQDNDTVINFENVLGSTYNDELTGDAGNNVLNGNQGTDYMTGGDGSDTYYVESESDNVTETNEVSAIGGIDTVVTKITYTLGSNVENLVLASDLAIDGTGNALNNTIYSGAGDNIIDGGAGIDLVSYMNALGGVTVDLTITTTQNTIGSGNDTLLNIEHLQGSIIDSDDLRGNSGNNILYGLGGLDTLSGAAGNDTLSGGDDNDQLAGGDGNDVLQGDAGNDAVAGGNGNDYLAGGAGNDTLDGGAGTDVADYRDVVAAINVNLGTGVTANDGEGGSDTLIAIENIIGGAGNDTLTGDALANRIEGRAGNDNLVGGDGSDTLVGGAGFDTLNGGLGTDFADYTALAVAVNVNLATGIASADGSGATDTLIGIDNILGGTGNDTLTGDANGNRLEGRNGNDSLVGGAGNDTFLGGNGADTMDGGIGTDFLDYSTATAAVTANLATGTTSDDGTGAIDTFTGMEYLIGGSAGDFLTGDAANNRIEGRNGNDSLVGADGSDTLTGDAGNDTLDGGNAADTLIGGAGADVLDGGAGIDVLDYRLQTGGVNANLLTGTASNDGSGSIDTLANFENMIGGTGSDTLTGDAGNNRIEGLSGNDNIDGGDGADTLIGGLGADTINGGNGVDMLDYTSTGTSVTVNLLAGTATDGSGTDTVLNVENINGGSGADTLIGDAGNNRIDGSFGSDSLSGGDGNDTLIGGTGFDTLNGGNGIDLVDYTAMTGAVTVNLGTGTASDSTGGTDTLVNVEYVNGGAAGDTLIGNAANNRIEGRNGNDTITGAAGSDTLIGGAGNDVFRFVTTADGSDTLSDFTSGTDAIAVVAGNFGLTAGAAVTLLSGASTPTVSGAGGQFLYNTTSGALFFDRDGTGSTYAATQIATLAGSKTLVAADIQVVAS
ncbi:nidogen-like domain-containing protein [Janthinobacterium sp. 17J80-10]|uniref:beta strand repeat-containing protein n=1 Tax=Janthinobacterium sp. 17J80-10 TaxID=2497863 RepID=UPI0010056998|nr:nidogen-like domain-containing protein [Janthinobacterium sp. 17J80-10]QAU35560.1 hypothetical protein EKL02_16085 [Janthinobacterium sp. 17J80-10]